MQGRILYELSKFTSYVLAVEVTKEVSLEETAQGNDKEAEEPEPQEQQTEADKAPEGEPKIETEPQSQPEAEAEAEPKPEAEAEPKPEAEAEPKPEADPESKPEAGIEPAPEQQEVEAEVKTDTQSPGKDDVVPVAEGGDTNDNKDSKADEEDKSKEVVVAEVKPKEDAKREKVWTVNPGEGVDLAIGSSGMASVDPITVGQVFKNTLQNYPNRPGLRYKKGGEWMSVTFTEYYANCLSAAKSFMKVILINVFFFVFVFFFLCFCWVCILCFG